jgi:N utilization substance protein B
VTVKGLAKAIGRDVSEVQAILKARGEPDSEGDYLGSFLAADTARVLGCEVQVETRDLALEYLYEYESRGEAPELAQGRASRLVTGVVSELEQLDREIENASEHWSVARMPAVDRNILRLGLYELQNRRGTTTAVILSEAVRLAQTYSTEKSAAFVNGVLATLAKTTRND